MKKFVCLILAVLLTIPAQAAEYDSVTALWDDWSINGAPDWFCCASSTDGTSEHMTFVVKSAEAEEELLAMLPADAALDVVVSETAYTQAELLKIQEEIINTYMSGEQPPVAGVGIGWTVVDGNVTGFGESGREDRVVVNVLADQMDTVGAEIQETYGDAVYLEASEGYAMAEEAVADIAVEETAGQNQTTAILGACIAAALLAVITALVRRSRNKQAAADKTAE